ncbi:methylated-DNA-[protein]-cysteine S-methyltransferase [Candidatus Planktophila sulfonica]|uniref:methylated-DNA--[protein]-cysteine S-methyltransferase n=1 Tax=Candidatus Planktophila sulfonica TaxID=1884904 RepID=A0A249KG66_9ACTN|nr:methylated-DNA--[protein]-cysteine S-methyltransferase [Candidatus Planktophila sulfonica]ASY15798.1 methylated-DNA-[protein]-cysteine S-methyltransferase [Candidatus Planktophila sulfonica]
MTLLLSTLATPIGNLNLIADQHILLAANLSNLKALKESLGADDAAHDIKSVAKIPVITDLINDYFAGDISALNSIQVRQPGAPFSQAAWKAMRKVKPGAVISYADLADRAGSPAAVRAAGSACAKNAIVLIVPCHRIVKTGGALGNYAYGLSKKEWLLRHEGAL